MPQEPQEIQPNPSGNSSPSGQNIRFVDRTRMLATQRCPRSRWLGWEFAGRGLEPKRLSLPLATGGAVHAGLAELLQGRGTESAVAAGQEFLARIARDRGFQVEELEQESEVFAEQLALTEALVRLAGMRVVPRLRADVGQVLPEWTEKEITRELAPGIVLMARPDGMLLTPERDGLPAGELIISWKTAASWDRRKDSDARVDMQGLSESWAVEEALGHPVAGVQMVYLLKGKRLPDKRQRGVWHQHSPLIRAWKKQDGLSTEYAWTYEWQLVDDETGGVATRRLGKGWVPFSVWREMGVAAWLSQLNFQSIQPEAGDCLESQYVLPLPNWRQERDLARWLRAIQAQELRVVAGLEDARVARKRLEVFGPKVSSELDEVLDSEFPCYTHSCAYPSRCNFWEICHGSPDVAADPLGSGLFQIRTPNHKQELGDSDVLLPELPEAA